MGKLIESISPELQSWIENQKMFFVATAPLSASGHINCSPKGLDSFRILNPNEVAYQDLTGSGAETIAHLRENKRTVIMFCAFDGPPKIVRLWGEGKVVTPADDEFEKVSAHFPMRAGVRAYIHVNVTRIADSCGFGVPLYDFNSDRDVLDKWGEKKGEDGLTEYRKLKNKVSVDGLPALD